MRDYRETIIRLDHDDGVAEVWTERAGLIGKFKRFGLAPFQRQGRGAWYRLPIRAISFRNPARMRDSGRTRASVAAAQRPAGESISPTRSSSVGRA